MTVAVSRGVTVRAAEPRDDRILQKIEVATWSTIASPGLPPAPTASFFASAGEDEVLVAEIDGEVAGYAQVGAMYHLASSAHVLELKGLAVRPDRQRQGIARLLVNAAISAASQRKARRLTLRVLASNAPAMTLYEGSGFRVEGILREQFLLDGRYVDDVFMAIDLGDAT